MSLGAFELINFENSQFNIRNYDSDIISGSSNLTINDDGFYLQSNGYVNIDFDPVKNLQGSEIKFSVDIGASNVSLSDRSRDTIYLYFDNGKALTIASGAVYHEASGSKYNTPNTSSSTNITFIHNHHLNIILNANNNIKVYIDDNLEYTANTTAEKIIGVKLRDRSSNGFKNVSFTNLVLSSNIKYGIGENEIIFYNKGILYTKNNREQYPTNEITNIENDNIILYTENTIPTTPISPFIDISLIDNWGKIEIDLDSKVCFNFNYNTKTTISPFFCIKVNNEKYVRFEVVKLNASSNTYLSFGIDNSSKCLYYKDFKDNLSAYDNDEFHHIHLEISKTNIYAKVTIGSVIYEYTTPNLYIQDVKFGLVTSNSAVTLLTNYKHEYKNLIIKYSNPNLQLNIIKSNYIYLNEEFELKANVSSDFGTINYLWDNEETSSYIILKKSELGNYSNSCTVYCNSYSITKEIEYEVIKNDLFLNGKIIGFQNTISPNIFYNSNNDSINTELSNICYFETNNNKLYFIRNQSKNTSVSEYQSNYFDLSSYKNNITLEYNLYCPISTLKTNYPNPNSPIMNLRISENQYIYILYYSNGTYSTIYDAHLITKNGNSYTSSRFGYIENALATNNEMKVKVDITPKNITLTLNIDENIFTKTYNANIDKNYLGFIFYRYYNGIPYSNFYLKYDTDFYISDFIAYETGYEITDEDKQAINELMISQNDEYVAEHGITIININDPVINFNNFNTEDDFGKSITITPTATQENGYIKSYSWSSGENTQSIKKSYLEETTYTVTVTGAFNKTSSKSITIKGIMPELDEHIMWKLNTNNFNYFFYRDNDEIKSSELEISGNYKIGSGIVPNNGNYVLLLNKANSSYNGALTKIKFIARRDGNGDFSIFLNDEYRLIVSYSELKLMHNNDKLVSGVVPYSGDDRFHDFTYEIIIKGNIVEYYLNNTRRFKYIVNTQNFSDLKFDKLEFNYSSGNYFYIYSLEIQSIDIAEPNIEVITSNENAECFETVNLKLGIDQPCDLICNDEISNFYINEQLVESKIYNIKATNKLNNSLYKEIEYTQNVKELVNDIYIKNELNLNKIYKNQDINIDYSLPTTLPENAIIKYYIDDEEIQ